MRLTLLHAPVPLVLLSIAGSLFFIGCASTDDSHAKATTASATTTEHLSNKYRTDDGRNIEIGSSSPSGGGRNFKDPHLDKCWLADGFNFAGYDTLFIAPTLSTAKLHNDEEQKPHELAKENLPLEI